MKRCTKCLLEKPLTEFYKSNRWGARGDCKVCRKIYLESWHSRNPNYNTAYWNKNKDHLLVKIAEWRKINKDQQVKYRQEHKDRDRKQAALFSYTKYHSDIQYRIKKLLRGRLTKAVSRNQKKGSAILLLGCPVSVLIEHLEKQFKPGMSWGNHGEWHIDHIKPLASFDLQNPNQLSQACHYSNLQPLWAEENIAKNSKLLYDNDSNSTGCQSHTQKE
jgi:hypothetical protein